MSKNQNPEAHILRRPSDWIPQLWADAGDFAEREDGTVKRSVQVFYFIWILFWIPSLPTVFVAGLMWVVGLLSGEDVTVVSVVTKIAFAVFISPVARVIA